LTDEHLIAAARKRRPKRPSARDLVTSGCLAAAFLAAASAFAVFVPWNRELSPLALGVLVLGYAALSRVEFEVGPGSAVPIHLAFVPMLFALPVALVPLCVGAGYVLGALPDYVAGRAHPARALALLSSSWYSVGPTAVFALVPPDGSEVQRGIVYGTALVSMFALDFASSAIRERVAFGHAPRSLLASFAGIWAVDSLLAPMGLAAALSGRAGLMIVVPFVAFLALVARDRRVRIDRAVIVNEAYRGALDEAYRDDLSGIANRRKLLYDLERVVEAPGTGHVLVFYDLNGFKQYNDTFGHPAGDVMLRRLAGNLDCAVEPQIGSAYRLGGDEFCVLAAASESDVAGLLEVTMEALSAEGDGFSISACYGAVSIPSEAADAMSALTIADQRLYTQKRATRQPRTQTRLVLLESDGSAPGGSRDRSWGAA
jgi:diguanylate cyclase (GGDEF)-like protein